MWEGAAAQDARHKGGRHGRVHVGARQRQAGQAGKEAHQRRRGRVIVAARVAQRQGRHGRAHAGRGDQQRVCDGGVEAQEAHVRQDGEAGQPRHRRAPVVVQAERRPHHLQVQRAQAGHQGGIDAEQLLCRASGRLPNGRSIIVERDTGAGAGGQHQVPQPRLRGGQAAQASRHGHLGVDDKRVSATSDGAPGAVSATTSPAAAATALASASPSSRSRSDRRAVRRPTTAATPAARSAMRPARTRHRAR